MNFKVPARTSRNIIAQKNTWFFIMSSDSVTGIGECAPLSGLSTESEFQLESDLRRIVSRDVDQNQFSEMLYQNSSLRFGVETACLDFMHGGQRILFPGFESSLILINGLVWMNDIDTMLKEAEKKINEGFQTIKFKVGALDFDNELALLVEVRRNFPDVVIRLDANGAFSDNHVLNKLKKLAVLNIHSIEQPVHSENIELMKFVVAHTPIPVALDEQLIGVNNKSEIAKILSDIKPHYIVLKPTLHGGLSGCDEWIQLAENAGIGWWATSALESNIGLNAIAQWTATMMTSLPQGLGTGGLFINNFPSPLYIKKGNLGWDMNKHWDISEILQ